MYGVCWHTCPPGHPPTLAANGLLQSRLLQMYADVIKFVEKLPAKKLNTLL